MEQKNKKLNLDDLLRTVWNNIVKIIPENSFLFNRITIMGLKINAKKHHVPLSFIGNGGSVTQQKENLIDTKMTGNIISIQLLRAIAALSVVYVHCTTKGDYNFFSTGAFGVDIFFIISGFIIAYMVSKTTEKFLIKRIIRIVPLYFLATVAMILTVMFFPSFIRSTTISISGFIKSIFFIPGPENRGQPILAQGWTLNYEMFFYIIMFLCIIFIKNKKYFTIACISVLALMTIVLYLINSANFIINYYKNGLFLEFIYGIILYHVYIFINKHARRDTFVYKTIKIIILLCLAIGSYGFLIFTDFYKFYFSNNRNFYYGIPALLLVMAILFMEKILKKTKSYD